MINLFFLTDTQELLDKVLTIVMPILIAAAVVSAIIMVAYYAIAGKFAADAANRKETIKKILWVLICLAIVILAAALVLGFKDSISQISS